MNAKEKKRWLLLAWICLSIGILCSCMGSQAMQIDTTLQMNTSFKGKREMSAVVSKSVFDKAFNGDLDELQKLVTERCPAALLCEADETEDGVEITMTLDFVSLKDYTNKIGLILGRTPGIYYDASDSIFKNGFVIDENFSSLDLFDWLVQALKEQYPQFEKLELDDIFEIGTTMVQYDNRTFESDGKIHVEDMDSNSFERISAEITMNTDASYKAELNFFVNTDTYYAMGDTMDEAIKELVPDGGIFEASTNDEERVYSIAFSALNDETLVSQLNRILKTKNCKVTVKVEGDEADPFRAHKEVEIYLDGSYFLDFTKEDTELIYKLNVDSNYGFDRCESITGFLKDSFSKNEGKYTSIYMIVGPSDEVRVHLTYPVEMQKLEVTTKIMNEDEYKRDFRFVFSSSQEKLVGKNFKNRLSERMDENMSMKVTESEGYVFYTVSFFGKSLEEISRETTRFLEGSLSEDIDTYSSVITGGKSKKETLKTKSYVYEDTIDFETFLGSASIEEGITYCMEYPQGYSAVLVEGSYDNVREEKNILKCTTKDAIVHVKSCGETSNIAGLTQLILWWLSLGLTLISFVLNIRHIVGYMRHKEKYLLKVDLFKGKNQIFMTVGIISLVVFVFTTLRLVLRIY